MAYEIPISSKPLNHTWHETKYKYKYSSMLAIMPSMSPRLNKHGSKVSIINNSKIEREKKVY